MEEARAWAGEIVQLSPTAIKLAKQSFNMSSEKFRGVEAFASSALALYYDTDEAMEGRNAFIEKRRPDRSEEHTSELQSLMRISYAVFCLKKKNKHKPQKQQNRHTKTKQLSDICHTQIKQR